MDNLGKTGARSNPHERSSLPVQPTEETSRLMAKRHHCGGSQHCQEQHDVIHQMLPVLNLRTVRHLLTYLNKFLHLQIMRHMALQPDASVSHSMVLSPSPTETWNEP